MKTSAPNIANRCAIANPIPLRRLTPVTRATRPFNTASGTTRKPLYYFDVLLM
ncbi:MAG: hypothetical protein ICV54_18950 [Nostoc sp. C3-bin3]|nr:hypothetical protein [Nostoc sp. C3-bin3]